MKVDVIVVGAGLGGLACARDLQAGGADVLVVEARGRTGGRVEATTLADGRVLQLGGEICGTVHLAYRALAAELGLELVPSYTDAPGVDAYDLVDGVVFGDVWLSDEDRDALARMEDELLALARRIDPEAPLDHDDAVALDSMSVGDFARAHGATAGATRRLELSSTYTAGGTIERLSVLGELRAIAAGGGHSPRDYSMWENLKIDGGSSVLVDVLTAGLGDRIRLSSPVSRIVIGTPCQVVLVSGEILIADSVVCAVPVGPLRGIDVAGLSAERLRSLHRQREIPASKAVVALESQVWERVGCTGQILSERETGGFWVQDKNTLSSMNGPDLQGLIAAAPPGVETEQLLASLRRVVGDFGPATTLWRHWGRDPYTLGYVSHWAPGDLVAVGPLHGTHEPPFYVAGSDHWAAGYMEGAIATGRATALHVLGRSGEVELYPAAIQ